MWSLIFLVGCIFFAWAAGHELLSAFFAKLDTLQHHPPAWIHVPQVEEKPSSITSGIVLFLIVLVVTRMCPTPQPWSRVVIVGILSLLVLRYLLWRSLSTLNFSSPLNGFFSLGLLGLELLMLSSSCIQFILLLKMRDRHSEADILAVDVLNGSFNPSVDILIPTYDEPLFILKRTIVGCQALDYPRKSIYLLDDTQRPEVQALAKELGCEYITRSNNLHAKAGNLNHALQYTSGELLLVFDADFVPTKNFLIRTVGFFQDPNVALVQTPQSFYNADPIARNLGLEGCLTSEEEIFYRQIQPMRDGAGGVVCSGTSFIVRRSALEALGGFVTESLSEDYFTGIRLAAQGHRLVYLDEKLSAGLAAENISAQAIQRIRWARGTLQAFFIRSNPLTVPGLRSMQRLAHLEGILHWFTSLSRVGFLLMPLVYSFFHVIPLRATPQEVLYFFLPYYLVQLMVFSWLNHYSRSALLSDIYSLVLCFPLAFTVLQSLTRPFGKNFRVTPKGTSRDHFRFNWHLAWPLIGMLFLTALSLWMNIKLALTQSQLEAAAASPGFILGWIWSLYNLLMLSIALLILLDVPRPFPHEWFDLRRTVKLTVGDRTFWGITTMMSEGGAEVALTTGGFPLLYTGFPITVDLNVMEDNLSIRGMVTQAELKNEFPHVRIMFEPVPLHTYRRLVEMLFCRPGQWKRVNAPSEWRSLVILFKIIVTPRFLFDRTDNVKPVPVVKT